MIARLHAIRGRRLFFLSFILAYCSPLPTFALNLSAGAGRFEFVHGGTTIPVWYYLPEGVRPDAPVLFVMHGVNRDADRYRNEWEPHAAKHGFILLCPQFTNADFPGEESYNFGNLLDSKRRLRPRERWSFRFLEPIFDEVRKATGNRSERYHLYGHSAGAQFVHRYLFFMPEARIARAVAANAGVWTVPDLAVDYPYGLGGVGVDAAAQMALFTRPLVVLLGTADTDQTDIHLRRTAEAMVQGPHRFARGQYFFATARRESTQLGVPLAWRLATAPDIEHSNKRMAPFAVQALFERR
jgi:poly(3-hydroxybutyrate) depolymerase